MRPQPVLPIKVVFPSPIDYQAIQGGGSKPTFFGEFSDDIRKRLVTQIEDVGQYFTSSYKTWGDLPAVAKVRLKPEALAKSHRPDDLFNENTCPVVGANRLGELFVSVRPEGLNKLSRKIHEPLSQEAQANLTAIKEITPFTSVDAIATTVEELVTEANKQSSPGLRYRLFQHPSEEVNAKLEAALRKLASEAGVLELQPLNYGPDLRIFRVRASNNAAVQALAGFIGTQSLSPFPDYRIVRSAARVIGDITPRHFPPPDAAVEYPVVGIIDSGTDLNNPYLQAWIAGRLDLVPRSEQNNAHGSFVGAIVAGGRALNHNDPRFPKTPCKIIDVVALDKSGTVNEMDLLDAIDKSLTQFPLVQVWNLSLGGPIPCCDEEFSMLGAAIDDRARTHNKTFVVAAGNYTKPPLRGWPPDGSAGEDDRICSPADSVRAITVASRAHTDTPSTRVRREEPSPFSRRGPGPAYLIKPELSHYGGNCDGTGSCVQSGIISVDGAGHLAEDIGTSFACPSVTAIAGHVEYQLRGSAGIPASLVKALLVHSALLGNPKLDADLIKYQGVGIPGDVDRIITCGQSEATLILQIPLQARPEFGKRPFPMPHCLIGPKGLNCEIFMTLLYDPPLDRAYGIEYCRTNVSASLGTITINTETGEEIYNREVGPMPKQLTDAYEDDLIKHGYKWSPLKLYYRRFHRGPTEKPWRLTLELLNRAEYAATAAQDVVLVITLRDPAGTAPVYDELVQAMNQLNWNTQDLQIRTRVQI